MCIQIDNPITVSELVERWKDIDVDGVKFDFHTIIEMFKAGEFNVYRKVAPSPRNGKMGYKCEEFTESMKEFMQFPDDGKYYILDLMEVEKYELNFKKEFTPSFSDVCARFMIPEDQFLRMLCSMAKGKEIPNPHGSSRGWSITTRLNDVAMAFFYDGDLKVKLAEIEAINKALRTEIEELRKANQKNENNEKDEEDFPEEYENHGIFTVVAKMVFDRAPIGEIMKAIDNEKEFLSQREVGYFFHPSPEGKATTTLRNYTKNNKVK